MASTDYFLHLLGGDDIANGGGGGAAAPTPEKGGGAFGKKVAGELKKGNSGQKKGLGATLGIKFGIASLLKQSQVFTGFIGTIFQLMGALVDVILAPFLPILIPGIRLIASLIPYVSKYAQAIYDFLDRTIFAWFRSFPLSDNVKEGVKKALSAILVGVVFLKFTGMWNIFKSLVSTFIGKPMWGLLKKMFPQIDTLMTKFAGKTFSEIIQMAGKAAIRAVVSPWWDSFVTKMGLLTDFVAAPFKLLWAALKTGFKTAIGATLDDLVRRVWTNGIKSGLVTPLMTGLTGIAGLIAAPFASLWRTITGNVATSGDGIITRGLTALKNIPGVKTLFAMGKSITDYMKVLADWFMNLPFLRVIKNLPGNILNFITTDVPRMIAGLPIVATLTRFLEASLKKLLEKAGGMFGRAFGAVKGAVGFVKGKVQDTVAPKLMQGLGKIKPSHLLNAAKGLKAIPVLGAVAEAGFGAYAVYKDYKKYGAKAAGGRLALTLANVGTALFDPTGLASAAGSIGTNIAMDQAYKRLLDPKDSWKRDNPDIYLEVKAEDGSVSYIKKQAQDANRAAELEAGKQVDKVSINDP